jgi:hypothetical protein
MMMSTAKAVASQDCKARAAIRVRVRRIVIRVAVHDTVVRVRAIAGAKETTPTEDLYLLKAMAKVKINPETSKRFRDLCGAESEQPPAVGSHSDALR